MIERRSRYVRAMNMILSDGERILMSSSFNEDPDYFTMHRRDAEEAVIVCSDPWPGTDGWRPIPTGAVLTAGGDAVEGAPPDRA